MKKRFFLKKLALFLIPVLVPLLILGILSIFITQRYVKEEIINNNINLLKQTKGNIESVFDELNSLNLNFSTNTEIAYDLKSILKSSKITLAEYSSLKTINNFIDASANARPYIDSIYVYLENENGRFLTTVGDIAQLNNFYDVSWYESFLKHKENSNIWTEVREFKKYEFESKATRVITIYKKLISQNGVIVLNILLEHIENQLNSLITSHNQSILVVDKNNQVIFKSSNSDYLKNIDVESITKTPKTFFELFNSKYCYAVSKINSEKYGWQYISIIPQNSLYKIPLTLRTVTFILFLLALALAVILAYFFTKRNYKNINNIISILESAENGDPLPALPSRIHDEYSYIIQNILKTFIEHSFLKTQLSAKKYKMKVMELKALQSQINPHFLFNTLKTIYWKSFSITGKPCELSHIIENLSDILYYVLGTSEKTVSVEDEIKNTMSYVEIQKIRYRDKFDIIWEYEDNVKKYRVIKLLLQPLVENCIYHGIKEKEGKSIIKIKIYLMKSYLKISVVDNGLGITPSRLKSIRQRLNKNEELSEHIGLFNTNKRLKLTYGNQYGIKIRSRQGLGTVVFMYIPI